MKALVYDGPRQVAVKEVPDARIERPTDVLVKITDPRSPDTLYQEGEIAFDYGAFWFKGRRWAPARPTSRPTTAGSAV
jgi:glutathione-independent formaldehyde dehydrogenase